MSSIYFISDGAAIKIGRSKDVGARLRELSCGSARKLSVIATIDGGPAHERKAHIELADYRLNGEWFADCDHVRSAISRYVESGISVQAGGIDIGPESDAVRRCRMAAQILVNRQMSAGLAKMAAYTAVAQDIGTNPDWLRKFIAATSGAKEPKLSVGLALLESAGLLVARTPGT